MDIGTFTEFKTGKLLPIQIAVPPGTDWAFLPDPLSDSWNMANQLWPLVANARDYVGRLEQIKAVLPHPRLLLRPLQRREALRSSSLEGTYATPAELLLFEIEHNRAKNQPGFSGRNDAREVCPHNHGH